MSRVKILTIVDVQNDFLEGGALGVEGSKAILPIINDLIEHGEYDMIIATKDWHTKDHISFAATHDKNPYESINIINEETEQEETVELWPRHCVARTFGAAISSDLIKQDEYIIVHKGEDKNDEGFSGFSYMHKEAIDNARKHKETLTLDFVGIATDYCVFSTAKDTAEYVNSIGAEYLISVNVLSYACVAINPSIIDELYSTVPLVNFKKIKL